MSDWIPLQHAAKLLNCKAETLFIRARKGELRIVGRDVVPRELWKPKHRAYVSRQEVESITPVKRVRSCSRGDALFPSLGIDAASVQWVAVNEAADLLGVTADTVYAYLLRDELFSVGWRTIPSDQRVPGAKVYLMKGEVEAAAADGWRRRAELVQTATATAEQWAYLAGLFDGEGCVHLALHKESGSISLALSIVNTNHSVIQWVADLFGGRIYSKKKAAPDKDTWIWHASTSIAYRALQGMQPYLIIKRRQADLGIQFFQRVVAYDGHRHKPLTPEERAWRLEQRQLMQDFNRKGKLSDRIYEDQYTVFRECIGQGS